MWPRLLLQPQTASSNLVFVSHFSPKRSSGRTLSSQCTAGDAMADFTKTRIAIEHLGRGRLWRWISPHGRNIINRGITYFRVPAAFKKRCDPDQAHVIVPHNSVFSVFVRHFECVLEHYVGAVMISFRGSTGWRASLPSKLSRPVFSRKDFFSLLYGMCLQYCEIFPMGYNRNFRCSAAISSS
jgi:hypothetical protein